MARLASGSAEERQFARRELEDARALAPGDSAVLRALGRLYVDGDMLLAARRLALTELRRDPESAEARFLLGEAWRREWLVSGDELVRDRAIAALARGLARRPGDLERARWLVPMLEDADERRPALEVAQLAARSRPDDPESWLLVAYAAQFAGESAIADLCFQRALPRLAPGTRRRFDDITPLLAQPQALAYRAMLASKRRSFEQRFWRDLDPDPTTPENEGQLEFWARVAHARLLYGVNQDDEWDTRAQVYIRFGRPEIVERNPVTLLRGATTGAWQAWTYPSLGMRVWMSAASARGHYGSLARHSLTIPVRAFPDSLLRHPELQGVHGGFAVFRRLPHDVDLLPIQQTAVRFAASEGGRVLGQAEIEAPPSTSLSARWVVLDSSGAVLARHESPFGASACEPATLRAASFAADLSPGRYRLAVRVDDGDARRAVSVSEVTIAPGSPALSLSDLTVVCGSPAASVLPGTGVRLEPSTGLRPQDGPTLHVYFEIYGLRPGPDGQREFDYECTVRPLGGRRQSWLARAFDPKPGMAPLQMSRRETSPGDIRRQFLSVPVAELPAGRYRVEVRVTDARSGEEAMTATDFTRR
jgi:GWxTD domain-containing protein